MSASITIWCDHPNCYELFYPSKVTVKPTLVRKEAAKREGWGKGSLASQRDLCPKHAAEVNGW